MVPHLVTKGHDEVQRQADTLAKAAAAAYQVSGMEDVTPEESKEISCAGNIMTHEAIMSVASIEDAKQDMETEDAPRPGEHIMSEQS